MTELAPSRPIARRNIQSQPKKISTLDNAMHRISNVAKESPFYHWLLSKGQTPDTLRVKLPDPWPGDVDIGRLMTHNIYMRQGVSTKIDAHFWDSITNKPTTFETAHSFVWLRDLRAAGGDAARKTARQLVSDWLDKYDRWDEKAWRLDLMGQRIAMWIAFYDFFCSAADEDFQKRYFASLTRQAKHLARSLPAKLYGTQLLHAAEGLIYAGITLTEDDTWTLKGFEILLQQIPRQIRKDGSHVSGNPQDILKSARVLLNMRYALNNANLPVPRSIQENILRMGTALRFFIYPDHRLALFHGGQESQARILDAVLSQIRQAKRPTKSDVIGGFERITQGRALLMIDTSTVPEAPYSQQAHSAPMAFEFVYGRDRIFTNCGSHPSSEQWQQVLRQTAAHNTLTLFDKSAHSISKDGQIKKSHSPICSLRRENKDACLIDMSHDAYRAGHGIDHKRRFYLSQEGTDLRGEDTLLSRVPLTKPAPVTLRFHLHPRVQISDITEDGDIILTLPAGTSWRFCVAGVAPQLEGSVYMGSGIKPLKSKQIVIKSAMTGDEFTLKWALQRA